MNYSQIENSMIAGAQASVDADEEACFAREALELRCHAALKQQARNALGGIGCTVNDKLIPTHKESVRCSALALVQDQLGESKGDALLIEMLVLVRGIARSETPAMSAYAGLAGDLLDKLAEYHADYYASDLADEVEADFRAGGLQ